MRQKMMKVPCTSLPGIYPIILHAFVHMLVLYVILTYLYINSVFLAVYICDDAKNSSPL